MYVSVKTWGNARKLIPCGLKKTVHFLLFDVHHFWYNKLLWAVTVLQNECSFNC